MFIYDEKLCLYINLNPLLISSRVLKAVTKIDPYLRLQWDEHGFVCGISHVIATKLTKALGKRILNVKEFMQLARRHPQLQSEQFSEWLSDTYQLQELIELPASDSVPCILHRDPSSSFLISSDSSIKMPIGRPGWFHLDEISDDGLPVKLSSLNQPGHWKFWSPESTEHTLGSMRGFVASSGTCSLDLGILITARHPKIMIRECYEKVIAPATSSLVNLWPKYEDLIRSRDINALKSFLTGLDLNNIMVEESEDEFINQSDKERLIDLKGKKCLLDGDTKDLAIIDENDLLDTLRLMPDDGSFFVIGHSHPDADCIVSSIFEAIRRCQVNTWLNSLPWSESIPREVQHILGHKATSLMSRIPPPSEKNGIILVDCHQTDPKYQMQVRAIIDHHLLEEKKFPYYVVLSHEVCWSSTIQVYIKILGSGFDLSPRMAKILIEATRFEAELALLHRMSETDRLVMQRLESIAGYEQAATYQELTNIMVSTTDAQEIFHRDYRQTSYGFSVVKCKEPMEFSNANLNNTKHHLPLTVVKQTAYSRDFTIVISETIALVTNPSFHDKGFKSSLLKTVAAACQIFHGRPPDSIEEDLITMNDNKVQTPRLLLLPLIETIVKEHMKFRYVSSIDRYISIGFYSGSQELYGQPGDADIFKTGLSFLDVKALLTDKQNTSFLTLPEFWKVCHEMQARKDIPALKSLGSDRYIELFDTLIKSPNTLIHGSSPAQKVNIQAAQPALIRPSDGDEVTGLPAILHSPDKYDDKSLWRYWSPDTHDAGDKVATRGHIFVMSQTSIDLKVRLKETTKQLTFKPVYRDIPDMRIQLEEDCEAKWIRVKMFPRMFSVCKE